MSSLDHVRTDKLVVEGDRHPPASGARHGGPSERLRIAFYSHDTLGLGHIRRNLLIAQILARSPLDPTILVLAGTGEASVLATPPGADCLTLPSLRKDERGVYHARRLRLTLRQIVDLRAHIIQGALEAFGPDVLIVDTEPRGAFRELDPALSCLRMRGRTWCVLGMRDVRDQPLAVRWEWRKASAEAAIGDYYDQVWVYGDQAVCDVVREYGLSRETASRLTYTGYLDQRVRLDFVRPGDDGPRILETLPPGRLMLCMVGGGQDGARLARAFATAALPDDAVGLILAGPHMPASLLDELRACARRNPRLRALRFVPEPIPLVCRADRIVTMGGYNSTLEAVSFEKRALIVPRVKPRTEQWIRAERLRALGLVDVLHPGDLTQRALSDWLARDLAPPRIRDRLDLGGLTRIASLLRELRPGRADRPEVQ